MTIAAIDPGTRESAIVIWDGDVITDAFVESNEKLVEVIRSIEHLPLVIEKVESFGMAIGLETLETVFWSGVFAEAHGRANTFRMGRKAVKIHHCGSARATDANIRAAIVDRFGGQDAAFGKKSAPGPLYGITGHKMAAFALALAWIEKGLHEEPRLRRTPAWTPFRGPGHGR